MIHPKIPPPPRVSAISVRFDEARSRELRRSVFKVTRTVQYRDALGVRFAVPKGFETDLASVPRWLWPIFPPYGFHLRAAIVHDWLYHEKPVARARADAIFLSVMQAYGTAPWRARLMYLAVRAFGGGPWAKSG